MSLSCYGFVVFAYCSLLALCSCLAMSNWIQGLCGEQSGLHWSCVMHWRYAGVQVLQVVNRWNSVSLFVKLIILLKLCWQSQMAFDSLWWMQLLLSWMVRKMQVFLNLDAQASPRRLLRFACASSLHLLQACFGCFASSHVLGVASIICWKPRSAACNPIALRFHLVLFFCISTAHLLVWRWLNTWMRINGLIGLWKIKRFWIIIGIWLSR